MRLYSGGVLPSRTSSLKTIFFLSLLVSFFVGGVSAENSCVENVTQEHELVESKTINDFTTSWYYKPGLINQEYIITIQNLQGVNREINVSSLISETNFDIEGISNIHFSEYKLVPYTYDVRHYDNVTAFCCKIDLEYHCGIDQPECEVLGGVWEEHTYKVFNYTETVDGFKLDWKPCKMNTFSQGVNNIREDYGDILIPKYNSKYKEGTVNGTKIFKLIFNTPVTSTDNGFGSTGKVALLLNGIEYCPYWDTNWSAYSTVTTDAVAPELNYQVNFSNASFTIPVAMWNAMNQDGNDTRILNYNHTIEFPFWIEHLTARDNYKIWINVTNNDSAIYNWYYLNSTVSSESDGNDTFVTWRGLSTASYSELTGVPNGPYIYESKVKETTGSGHFVQIGLRNTAWDAAYDDVHRLVSSNVHNLLVHENYNEGTYSREEWAARYFTQNTWYAVRMVKNTEPRVLLYLNNVLQGTGVTGNMADEEMGLYMKEDIGQCEQDWSFVRKYASDEPEVTDISEPHYAPGYTPPTTIGVTPSSHGVYGHYDADLLLENVYSTGFVQTDIDFYTEMTSTQYTALSTNDASYTLSGGDAQDDGYLYVNFSVPNVTSINYMDIDVVGKGDEHWYMGAYNYTSNKWETMGDTTNYNNEVLLEYLVEGDEVANYSQITDHTATFSIALWESDTAAGIVHGDFINVTFNYQEYNVSVNATFANVSGNVTFADTVAVDKTIAGVEYDANVSDNVTITDTVSVAKTVAAVVYEVLSNDNVTITDVVEVTKEVAPVLYEIFEDEIISIVDSVSITKIVAPILYYTNISDTVTFADTMVFAKTVASVAYFSKANDNVTFADTVGINKTVAIIVYEGYGSDNITFTGTVTINKTVAPVNYSMSVGDTMTIEDGIAINKTVAPVYYDIDVSDTITLTDTISMRKTSQFNVMDTITVSDSIYINKTVAPVYYDRNVSDTITFADTIGINKTVAPVYYDRDVSDNITFSDGINVTKTVAPVYYDTNVSDNITFADTVALNKTVAPVYYDIDVPDTITISGTITLNKTVAPVYYDIDVSDTISLSDTIYVKKDMAILPPVVTLLSQTPGELYQNSTGDIIILYGISHDDAGLSNINVSFIYRNYDPDCACSNHSIRVPENNLATIWDIDGQILRAANRNESLNFEDNASITGGDIFSWSGLDENSSRLNIVPVNDTYTYVWINGTVHDVMPQMWYLDRSDLQEAAKTQMPIHKTQSVLVKFWNFEIFKNNSDFLGVGYTDTWLDPNPGLQPSDANPISVYYVPDTYDPSGGIDPITTGDAVYMISLNGSEWMDHVYSPHPNSNYVRGFVDNNILEQITNVTNISYLYYTSNTPTARAFYINVTDVASSTNISFADTNTLWTGDGNLIQQPYTPNIWFAFMKDNITFDHMLYVSDNNSLWSNSTLNSTVVQTSYFPPTKPIIDHFHYPDYATIDYNMDSVYFGIFDVGIAVATDPDGGPVNMNLTLHYDNGTLVAVINNTISSEDIIHNGIYTCAEFDTSSYYSDDWQYTLKIVATDNEGKTSFSWLGVNFTLTDTPTIMTYAPETPVASNPGVNRTFNISVNQVVNVTWYMDSVEVYNQTGVNESMYSNSTDVLGIYNITVIVENVNGTDQQQWAWSVENPGDSRLPIQLFFMFIGVMGICFVGSVSGIKEVEQRASGIVFSMLGLMIGFYISSLSFNGNLIEMFGYVSNDDIVVFGYNAVQIPGLYWILIFLTLIFLGMMVYTIGKFIKEKTEPVLEEEVW